MNILDITNEDIARLQENKIVFGLMGERDVKILRKIDIHNTESYCASGFYRCRAGASFNGTTVYRIRPGYTPPAPTESEIIAYLQASEVPPSQWHPAAQEWAKSQKDIWEYYDGKTWNKCGWVGCLDDNFSIFPHRLRADYGKAKVLYGKMEDFPVPIPEPEVCVWGRDKMANYVSKCNDRIHCSFYIGEYTFCPYCGKRIEVKV